MGTREYEKCPTCGRWEGDTWVFKCQKGHEFCSICAFRDSATAHAPLCPNCRGRQDRHMGLIVGARGIPRTFSKGSPGPSLVLLIIPLLLVVSAVLFGKSPFHSAFETKTAKSELSPTSQSPQKERRTLHRGELNERSRVSLRSIGAVTIGMSMDEAAAAIGRRLIRSSDGGGSNSCYFAEPENGPKGVAFMVTNGRIARIDITEGPIATASGIRIGDREESVLARYGKRISAKPNQYDDNNHDLVFLPQDSKDKNYRLILITNKGTIAHIIAGRLPEAEVAEGCL